MDEIVMGSTSKDDRNLGMLAHLLGIFTHFLGASIIWIVKKDDSPFVATEAVEVLNFQITLFIGFVVAGMLCIVLIGFALIPLLYLVNIIFSILGAMAASKGQHYRYPFAIRLVS